MKRYVSGRFVQQTFLKVGLIDLGFKDKEYALCLVEDSTAMDGVGPVLTDTVSDQI